MNSTSKDMKGLPVLRRLKVQSDSFGNSGDSSGDEMNLHSLQSLESLAELSVLSTPTTNIISAQSSKPILDIVQDSLLAIYKMTIDNRTLEKHVFFNIIINSETCEEMNVLDRMKVIEDTLKSYGKPHGCLNGRGIISMVLPTDFNYKKTNNATEKEPAVIIKNGVLIEGVIDKQIVGASYNSIIQILNKEYGGERACRFIDDVHFLTNSWLLQEGFSIGLSDCLVSTERNKDGLSKTDEINDYIQKCFLEADGIRENTRSEGIKEIRVNAALGKAKDVGLKIAKDALKEGNNFLATVRSGSKGDFFNIAQITGVIGQQNIKGNRIPYQLNNNSRALPHYPFELRTPLEEYESKGFISSSFIKGLNPRECYFHAMSGRDGISDTAMGTANSGYMQRRIVKLLEDLKVQYDGTVRDAQNNIYQFLYGNDGFDCKKTVRVGESQEFCNISRIVDRLNDRYEKDHLL
jgi:DNA-directed RNA polymerase II subunit RPB1